MARQIAEKREARERAAMQAKRRVRRTLEDFMASMEKGESQELNLILKGDVSGSVEALEDALAQDRRRRRGQPAGHRPRCRCDHRDQRRPGRRLRRHHHRLQRPARRARRPRWPTRKASRSATTRSSTRRSRRSRRPSRACSSRSTRSRRSARRRSARSSARPRSATSPAAWSPAASSAATPRCALLRDGAVVADNLDLASLRREKDDASEVREGFECGLVLQELPGHQDRRRRGGLRDARDPARLTAERRSLRVATALAPTRRGSSSARTPRLGDRGEQEP